ncbi:juvenile hormone esterase-like isoform X2 [Spodoptera litura]|uniref:Juvenile hormone esterase-like isoform X2 n=1 Tax=Spodoptera litura TaxID=69820 RepID=A0A9J7J1N9_SPOLT|nr:juvenile hormone esterase-like isoform X2 [Spodoptera litura]
MALSLLFILFLFTDFRQVICKFNKTRIVNTQQGQIEGYLVASKIYYEFCGIRYAITKNRYTAPVEPPMHKGVFRAEDRLVFCPQFQAQDIFAKPSDNEDCLILNVYVPSWTNITSLPVIVFLHGGDFGVGSSSPTLYGPKFLMTKENILVTVNYRLNAFGFLNLGTKEAPGNAGLKDIRAALRWIKKNIRNFGGDDKTVTVLGQGSGGIAAIYLTLSRSCKGLFHRIISMSGTLFSATSFDPFPLATASQVAKALGLNSMDPEELTSLYLKVPINKLEEAISHQMNAKSTFLPSVEKYLDDDPFLTDTPFNVMYSDDFNPVPAIFGLNTVEGIITILDYYTFTSKTDRILNGDYSVLDQRNFKVPSSIIGDLRKELMKLYFSGANNEQTATGSFIQYNTDFQYVGPMAFFTEAYTNNSKVDVFQYIFNYKGKRNLGTLLTGTTGLPSTTNMDDLFYIFDLEKPALYTNTDDALMASDARRQVRRMVTLPQNHGI